MKIESQLKVTCSKSAKYSDLLEKGTGHPGSCWILNKGFRFKKKIYRKPGGAAFDGLSRTSKPFPGQGEEHTQRRQSRSLVGSPSEFAQF